MQTTLGSNMGRTYEALSHYRTKRDAPSLGEENIPPTAFVPVIHSASEIYSHGEGDSDAPPGSTAVTALLEEPLRDDDTIPFVEVGGPRGTKPRYGPLVADTPVPNPKALVLEPSTIVPLDAPPEVEHKSIQSVSFFPLPERPLLDSRQMAPSLVAFHKPDDRASAQYRELLAGLEAQHPGVGCPLLVFTTVGQATEAATVILNLALSRAREENKRLLVIEANHEQPLIAERLGIAAQPGLRELLSHSIPLSVALHSTAQKNLYALPPGDGDLPVSHEAESRLPQVVEHLRKRFDWLLVNGPEWGHGGAAEWAALGDAAYLVVRHDQWDTPEVEAAHEAILQANGKLRGYVTLN